MKKAPPVNLLKALPVSIPFLVSKLDLDSALLVNSLLPDSPLRANSHLLVHSALQVSHLPDSVPRDQQAPLPLSLLLAAILMTRSSPRSAIS